MNDKIVQLPRMRSIKQAGAETRLAIHYIRRLIRENKVVYVKAGHKFLINMQSLYDYLNRGDGEQQ